MKLSIAIAAIIGFVIGIALLSSFIYFSQNQNLSKPQTESQLPSSLVEAVQKCSQFECPACQVSTSCDVQQHAFFPNNTQYAQCPPSGGDWLRIDYGISMLPSLSNGNWVKLAPYVQGMALKSGNWIEFDRNGIKTVHAIVAIYQGYVLTQGLNNGASDEGVPYSQIKGIVTDVRFC